MLNEADLEIASEEEEDEDGVLYNLYYEVELSHGHVPPSRHVQAALRVHLEICLTAALMM